MLLSYEDLISVKQRMIPALLDYCGLGSKLRR